MAAQWGGNCQAVPQRRVGGRGPMDPENNVSPALTAQCGHGRLILSVGMPG